MHWWGFKGLNWAGGGDISFSLKNISSSSLHLGCPIIHQFMPKNSFDLVQIGVSNQF